MRYKLALYGIPLGRGSFGVVFMATDKGSGRAVAIKKSRISKTVKRPTLQHETRVLQLLQGQAAIPLLYGYGRLVHFEYMSSELLGPSLAQMQKHNAGMIVKTVFQVVEQTLAGLEHIHSLGIVHRDIKPEHLLCTLDDPSNIKIIDFGISKQFACGHPSTCEPLKDRRSIVGTIYWASLNSHDGIDLNPRDDIESLALTALFLLRGHLPWKPRPRPASRYSLEMVRRMKLACSGPDLCTGFPDEFGELLTYSRSLKFDQFPDYLKIRCSFTSLADRMGYLPGPLDWTPYYPVTYDPLTEPPYVLVSDMNKYEDDHLGTDSYCDIDIDMWLRQGSRSVTVTLPAKQESELDNIIPLIVEVEDGDY